MKKTITTAAIAAMVATFGTGSPQTASAQIGVGSCVGTNACFQGPTIAGDNSCVGDEACYQGPEQVGDNTCDGTTPCYQCSASSIGNDSCNGNSPCFQESHAIGDNSCNGDSACYQQDAVNPGPRGAIGNHSCNGTSACYQNEANVGNFSCNGPNACVQATGLIGDCEMNTVPVPACNVPLCGDVNNTSSINTTDALLVLKKSVNQSMTLDCSAYDDQFSACETSRAACEASGGGPPATGQTSAYGTGSDGDVQAGVARSFTDNGDGTVTDNATGLMWEKKDASGGIHDKDNTYSWSTGTNDMDGTIATIFLATLNGGSGFAGHTDWRVPNVVELHSLTNYGAVSPATFSAFNTICAQMCTVTTCNCTQSVHYWTSTTYQNGLTLAWSVYFGDGDTTGIYKTNDNFVRAVRFAS